MAQPYIGEIRLFGGTFAPYGWSFCNGASLPISQNDALYNLIGTTYGGDGVQTFQLPNMQSRVPVHQGQGAGTSNYVLGQLGGAETVTLNANQLPSHTHVAMGSAGASQTNPAGNSWGNNSGTLPKSFAPGTSANNTMNAGSMGMTGGGQPHDNLLPFLVVSFIIALQGVYPTQN
jgi:microcystin-dependent protein